MAKSEWSCDTGRAGRFECRRCGRCCSNMSDLTLFEWEAERIRKHGAGHKAKVRPTIIAKVGNAKIVLQWGLESRNGRCPFLTAKGCKIYSDRPLVCRAFPLQNSGFPTTQGILSDDCPNIIVLKASGRTQKEFLEEMERSYGESFAAARKLDAARVWIGDLSRYTVRKLGPEIREFSGKELGLLELCARSGIYDRKFLRREIGFFTR